MVSTIRNGESVITPTLVNGFESRRDSRTVVHEIINGDEDDIDLRPAGLRRGRLELLFAGEDSEYASATAEATIATASVFTFGDDDRATVAMSFVVAGGTIERSLDDATRDAWIVAFDWREVVE